MKRLLLYTLLSLVWLWSPFSTQAQNLVANGGFEDYTFCPTDGTNSGIESAVGWGLASKLYAAYYNSCANTSLISGSGVPKNGQGNELAHTGEAYAGFLINSLGAAQDDLPNPFTNNRGYLKGKLTSALEKDRSYYFEMYLSLSDSSDYSANNIGVYFSDTFAQRQVFRNIELTPHIVNHGYIRNKNGWYRYSGFYKARGGEQLFVIGNFDRKEESIIQLELPPEQMNSADAFYYVDDVSLTPCYIPVNILPDTNLCGLKPQNFLLDATIHDSTQIFYLTYLWNTGSTDPSILIHDTGVYWVKIVTDKCVVTDTVHIKSKVPEIRLGHDTIMCLGKPFPLTPVSVEQTSHLLYRWSTGDSIPSILVSHNDDYWLRVTDQGCSNADTISVFQFPLKKVELGTDTTICSNTRLLLDATSPGASEYQWSTSETTPSIFVNTAGLFWAEASNGICHYKDSVMVNIKQAPLVDLENDTTICDNASLILDAGNSGAAFLWNQGSREQKIAVTTSGFYQVNVSENGCTSTDSLFVFTDPAPQLELGRDTLLCGDVSLLLDAASEGSSYLWSNGSITSRITVNDPGVYKVRVRNGACIVFDSIAVSVVERPTFSIGNDSSYCFERPVVLDAAGADADTYLWSNGQTGASINVQSGGIYWVDIAKDGCVFRDTAVLSQYPLPVIDLGPDTFFCTGASFTLDAGPALISYLWNNRSTQRTLETMNEGLFYVEVTNIQGCRNADTILLTVKPLPVITGIREKIALCDPDFTIDPGNFTAYLWQDGTTSATYHVTDYGFYTVQVTDANGCGNTAQTEVLNSCNPEVFVPNAFTPDENGLNDIFIPVYRNVRSVKFQIYDRWGQLLFETEDMQSGWDGKKGSVTFSADAYVYKVFYIGLRDQQSTLKGNFTLLR